MSHLPAQEVKHRTRVAAGLSGLMALLLAGVTAVCLSGCAGVGYYWQSVSGHLKLMNAARPVDDWVSDSAAAPPLKERLRLAQRIRAFASAELKLPDNASYRRYADLQRRSAVWNVVAAPELSLTLKTWCFPVMGCVGYRGYFDKAGADELATQLRSQGFEVYVYGVPAYSTLGWSNWLGGDPLLSTFIGWPEADLARLIFHELSHQVAYAADDTTFNESVAVAVERIGGRRWLAQHASDATRAQAADQDRRRVEFRAFAMRWRGELETLYAGTQDDAAKRQRKAEAMARMRAEYEALKAGQWGGNKALDAWMARANNATLGVMAAYYERVPEFEALFERCGSDFTRFYADVRRLAAMPRAERLAALTALTGAGGDGGCR